MAAETSAEPASIRIGAYALAVGSGSGSFAQYAPDPEQTNADALADALGAAREGEAAELRLMRSLNGLLALALRWLDLIRSLRSLLRSADAAGHAAGMAFAHQALGS